MSPEYAKSILEIADVMGGKNVTPQRDIVDFPQDQQALDDVRNRRFRLNFSMLGIEEGTVLEFKKDRTITCIVANDKQVTFRDKLTTLTRSADILLKEMGYDWSSANGPMFWCYKGKPLGELRLEREA